MYVLLVFAYILGESIDDNCLDDNDEVRIAYVCI